TRRLARRYRAEAAGAGTNISQNHERRRAMLPALAHVRATRALAHGIQPKRAHDSFQILVIGAIKEFDAQPFRPWMRVRVDRVPGCRCGYRVGDNVKWRSHRCVSVTYSKR